MKLRFTTLDDKFFAFDVNHDIALQKIKVLLELESGLPLNEMKLLWSGQLLSEPERTLSSYGIREGDMLLMRQEQEWSSEEGTYQQELFLHFNCEEETLEEEKCKVEPFENIKYEEWSDNEMECTTVNCVKEERGQISGAYVSDHAKYDPEFDVGGKLKHEERRREVIPCEGTICKEESTERTKGSSTDVEHVAVMCDKVNCKAEPYEDMKCSDGFVDKMKCKTESCDEVKDEDEMHEGMIFNVESRVAVKFSVEPSTITSTSTAHQEDDEDPHSTKSSEQVHDRETPFKYDEYGMSSSRKQDVKTHNRDVCAGERPFQCDRCDKSFSHIGTLQRHRRTLHAGERGFILKCHQCDESFSRNGDLYTHLRVAHATEWPFMCDECGKTFSFGSHLQAHKRAHKVFFTVKTKMNT